MLAAADDRIAPPSECLDSLGRANGRHGHRRRNTGRQQDDQGRTSLEGDRSGEPVSCVLPASREAGNEDELVERGRQGRHHGKFRHEETKAKVSPAATSAVENPSAIL